VRFRDATVGSFVAKVRGEVFVHFHAVPINLQSTQYANCFFLPSKGKLFVNNFLYIKENDYHALDFVLQLSRLLFFGLGEFGRSCVRLMLSFPNAWLITARVLVALFPRFSQNFKLFICWIHSEIKSHDSKEEDIEVSTSTQLREILYTDFKYMLVPSSTVASRYCNLCT
jgi:hypothetical protein